MFLFEVVVTATKTQNIHAPVHFVRIKAFSVSNLSLFQLKPSDLPRQRTQTVRDSILWPRVKICRSRFTPKYPAWCLEVGARAPLTLALYEVMYFHVH